jgi:hypothetical protein
MLIPFSRRHNRRCRMFADIALSCSTSERAPPRTCRDNGICLQRKSMAFAAAQIEDGYLPLDRTVHPQTTNVSPAQEPRARSRFSYPPSTASIRRRIAQYRLMVGMENMPYMVTGHGNTSMQPCSISDIACFCMCMPACHRTSDTNGQTNPKVVVNRRCVPT